MFKDFALATHFGHDLDCGGTRPCGDLTQKWTHTSIVALPLVPQMRKSKLSDKPRHRKVTRTQHPPVQLRLSGPICAPVLDHIATQGIQKRVLYCAGMLECDRL